MRTVARVAVSIPKKLLQDLDRASRRSKRSRSAIVSEAVLQYLHSSVSERDQRYIDAYKRMPDEATDSDATAIAVATSWDRW